MSDDNIYNIAKKELVKSAFEEKTNINTIKLTSLLSLMFKEFFNSDDIIQDFEAFFLRKYNHRITTLKSLIDIPSNDNEANNSIEIVKKILSDINNKLEKEVDCDEKIVEIIESSILDNKDLVLKYKENCCNQKTQIEIVAVKNKQYTLSPTGGFSNLNNNPYAFFLKKVLNLTPIDEWSYNINSRFYGTIVHEIMKEFHDYIEQNNKKDEFDKIFDETKNKIFKKNGISDDIFLRQKIEKIKDIAIDLENESIKNKRKVFTEYKLCTMIDNVKIFAIADRIEIDEKEKKIYIFDFKTGTIPTDKDEQSGEKVQLLIIGMLVLEKYKGYNVNMMKYINLKGTNESKDENIKLEHLLNIKKNVKELIKKYFYDNGQPNIENMKLYIEPNRFLYSEDFITARFKRKTFIK